MLSKTLSYSLIGIDAYPVEIEIDVKNGLPQINFVGLADQATKESKDRIRCAITNCGYRFPPDKITVNLAPADMPKSGPAFDLAVAIGILSSSEQIFSAVLSEYVFLGELSLDGTIKPVKGALPIALAMKNNPGLAKKLILPRANSHEAAIINEIDVFPVENFSQVVHLITEKESLMPFKIGFNEIFKDKTYPFDFQDVKGQAMAKRALEIAASGSHNLLMIGPPGSGKSMLAKRLPSILPDMTVDEAIETTQIHSSLGAVPEKLGLIARRPFCSPHHSISDVALVGGSQIPQAGQISLAHNGVLFLDELPEFRRNVLEALRQPLEEGKIKISRIQKTTSFPAKFTLIAAMNPCPCGTLGQHKNPCRCSTTQIARYRSKISGPLLDRIDIHIEVPAARYSELSSNRPAESSAQIKERVNKARAIQRDRFKDEGLTCNALMSHTQVRKFCVLGTEEGELLKMAMAELNFSARAYDKILKVSRTIADLAGSENIKTEHLSEAIQYRSLDREFFI